MDVKHTLIKKPLFHVRWQILSLKSKFNFEKEKNIGIRSIKYFYKKHFRIKKNTF